MNKWILTLMACVLAVALGACDRSADSDQNDGPAEQLGQNIDRSVETLQQKAEQLAESSDEYSGEVRDAWLGGKLEAAFTLNRHLNPLTINTDVENGRVRLDGTVRSDIDRDLAEQIARSVEGVTSVENQLMVDATQDTEAKGDGFRQAVNDLTTTAAIKAGLLANEHTSGMQIDVDTIDGVVTLKGTVESSEEKQLAGTIAGNARYVLEVNNELVVASS